MRISVTPAAGEPRLYTEPHAEPIAISATASADAVLAAARRAVDDRRHRLVAAVVVIDEPGRAAAAAVAAAQVAAVKKIAAKAAAAKAAADQAAADKAAADKAAADKAAADKAAEAATPRAWLPWGSAAKAEPAAPRALTPPNLARPPPVPRSHSAGAARPAPAASVSLIDLEPAAVADPRWNELIAAASSTGPEAAAVAAVAAAAAAAKTAAVAAAAPAPEAEDAAEDAAEPVVDAAVATAARVFAARAARDCASTGAWSSADFVVDLRSYTVLPAAAHRGESSPEAGQYMCVFLAEPLRRPAAPPLPDPRSDFARELYRRLAAELAEHAPDWRAQARVDVRAFVDGAGTTGPGTATFAWVSPLDEWAVHGEPPCTSPASAASTAAQAIFRETSDSRAAVELVGLTSTLKPGLVASPIRFVRPDLCALNEFAFRYPIEFALGFHALVSRHSGFPYQLIRR